MQKTLLHSKPDLVFLYHHNAVHTCLTNLPSYRPPHTQLQCPNPSPNQASPCFCSPQWFTSPQCLSLRLPSCSVTPLSNTRKPLTISSNKQFIVVALLSCGTPSYGLIPLLKLMIIFRLTIEWFEAVLDSMIILFLSFSKCVQTFWR
ncbi:hypothetical protein GBA52_020051 [Prunus armeniaca]|nr:hypothetical protein GBA52_020051 [Prunus armeniaca]